MRKATIINPGRSGTHDFEDKRLRLVVLKQ